MKESLDHVVLHFNKESLVLLNVCIAFIMFGVALELKVKDFQLLFKTPKPIMVGIFSQFVILPMLTFLLIIVLEPAPSMALGMILVASCPGGNVSNFYSSLSKANVALSVSLTAISSTLAVIMTPLNFTFWANMYEPTASILSSVKMNVMDVIVTVFIILIIPLTIGMYVNNKYPKLTAKICKPIKRLSILIFAAFVVVALSANYDQFITYILNILLIVLLHNALALSAGFLLSKASKLNEENTRSITIETGIQNSGVALVLIFEYFNGLGGMALIAAWWGVWHLISGAIISWKWSRKSVSLF